MNTRIKSLRTELGITQKELAYKVNLSQQTISGYENGSRVPDQTTLEVLADFFNVSIDYLIGRSEIRNQDKIIKAIEDDPELLEFYNEMKERENLKLLLKQTRMMDENGIRQILRIIKAIQDEEDVNG